MNNFAELYISKPVSSVAFAKLEWNDRPITKIVSHPLINAELIKLANRIKEAIHHALCRLGWISYNYTEQCTFQRLQLNLNDLFANVAISASDMQRIYEKEAKYLIVGNKQFQKLIEQNRQGYNFFGDSVDLNTMIQFRVPANYKANVALGKRLLPAFYSHLTIIVVPWINGMFLLPELT